MYKLGLSNPHEAFFCPETRLHLHYYQTTREVTVLSEAIKKALKRKKLVDLNGNIELKSPVEVVSTPTIQEPTAIEPAIVEQTEQDGLIEDAPEEEPLKRKHRQDLAKELNAG